MLHSPPIYFCSCWEQSTPTFFKTWLSFPFFPHSQSLSPFFIFEEYPVSFFVEYFHSYSLVHVISFSFFLCVFMLLQICKNGGGRNGSVLTGYWSGSIRNQCSKCFGPCFLIEPCQYHVPLLSNPHHLASLKGPAQRFFLFGLEGNPCFLLHFSHLLLSFTFSFWRLKKKKMLILTMTHCLKKNLFFLVCLRERLELATAGFCIFVDLSWYI